MWRGSGVGLSLCDTFPWKAGGLCVWYAYAVLGLCRIGFVVAVSLSSLPHCSFPFSSPPPLTALRVYERGVH